MKLINRNKKIAVSIVVPAFLSGCSFNFFKPNEAASIGIIGGADGPTAVFVTAKFPPAAVMGGICVLLLLAVVGAAVALINKHKK